MHPDAAHVIGRADQGEQRLGLVRRQLAAHPAGGELGQQPVQPAHRLGALRGELVAPVTQQPQAHQGIVAGHREHAGAIQCRQADRDRVVLVGLAAMPARVHPHPGGQLRRHIQHHLAIRDQPLGQRPARPKTSLDRPAALGPPAGEDRQLRITIGGVREPGRLDHCLGHRVQHRGGVARLVRVHRDHHIVAQGIPPGHRGCLQARRAMQLRAAQTSLEPQPHRVSRTGRGAVREPEHPKATAADSRASPPRSAPEDPRSPGSQRRSKQVADFVRLMAGTSDSDDRAQIIHVGASALGWQGGNGKSRQPVGGQASAACATAEGVWQRMMHRGG